MRPNYINNAESDTLNAYLRSRLTEEIILSFCLLRIKCEVDKKIKNTSNTYNFKGV